MNTSRLVIDEPPLIVLPSLVRALGDHVSALIVQQVHYRCQRGVLFEGERWAVATTEDWCEATVCSVGQFKRVMRQLADLGVLITVQPGQYDRTSWRRLDYAVVDSLVGTDRSIGTESALSTGSESDPSNGVESDRSTSTQNVEEVEQSTARPSVAIALTLDEPRSDELTAIDRWFGQFWFAYPRKTAKPTAARAFAKALKRAPVEVVMDGLDPWLRYWRARNEPEFVPHPATWLNQDRWNDKPPAAKAKPSVSAFLEVDVDSMFEAQRAPEALKPGVPTLDLTETSRL